jgi:hypothetical protein
MKPSVMADDRAKNSRPENQRDEKALSHKARMERARSTASRDEIDAFEPDHEHDGATRLFKRASVLSD